MALTPLRAFKRGAGELARALAVYCVFANRAQAESVCTVLVKEGLIACANIMPEALSVYTWKGNFQTGRETPAFLKTTSKRYPAL